jgi:hypothetical protein
MRAILKSFGLIAGVSIALLSATPASAADIAREPAGYNETRDVHHYRYVPNYRHFYHVSDGSDPYAYRYQRRGYYPYYHSNYWVKAEEMRKRYRYTYTGTKYRYSQSWGKPRDEHGKPKPQNEPDDFFHRKHW